MKKIYSILIMCMMFIMTSCMASIDGVTYTDEYLYLGTYYPVVYIDSYPYYFYNSQWIRIGFDSYNLIRHLNRPYEYHGYDYRVFRDRSFYRGPGIMPGRRFDNHGPQIYQQPRIGGNSPMNGMRGNGFQQNGNNGFRIGGNTFQSRPNTSGFQSRGNGGFQMRGGNGGSRGMSGGRR